MITKIIVGSKSKKHTYIKEMYLKGNNFYIISITNPEEKELFSSNAKVLNLAFTNISADLSPEYIKGNDLVPFSNSAAEDVITFLENADETKTDDILYILSEDNSRAASIAIWAKAYFGIIDEDRVIFCFEKDEVVEKNSAMIAILESQECL